jgi:crotonobetainyl-CoA:carnitine CoA-transferase CaiB-like acyl-CoA transferase
VKLVKGKLNFPRGKKGLPHFSGGKPPRFLLLLLQKLHKIHKKNMAHSLLVGIGMMEVQNSTSPNFTTPTPLSNGFSPQGQQLSPLSCLPEQFFTDATHSEAHWSGTRRLLFAVLQDAVACWFRYQKARSAQGRQMFREIREWFLTKNRDSLYAFENICTHLNLDAEYFRRGLMSQTTWTEQEGWASGHQPGRLTRRRS